MGFFKKKDNKAGRLDMNKLPRHIAIIMDGNGRWAKKRGLPRTAGHAVGAETFRKVATYCKDIGIKYLTVYAFSTENWKRPKSEVETIMSLLNKYVHEAIDTMVQKGIKIRFFGNISQLAPELQELIKEAESIADSMGDVPQVHICLNYGGRDEIIHAVKGYLNDGGTAEELTEEKLSKYLYSKDIPDPDLIIRPSGEYRLSNFLLWQSAYAEFYYTDALWPDFNENEVDKAIIDFQKRNRRFGAV